MNLNEVIDSRTSNRSAGGVAGGATRRNALAAVVGLIVAMTFASGPTRVESSALAAAPAGPAGTWTRYACADCIAAMDAGPDAVWVGLVSGGIVRWEPDGRSYQRWTRADGLTGDLVYGVAAAPEGTVWAMTGLYSPVAMDPKALSRYTPGAGWAEVALPPWFGDAYGRGMAADAPGVWIATADGLARYAGGTWLRIGASADTLPSADVFDVDVAPDGRVWVGTASGVARLDAAGTWSHLPWPAGAPAYGARWVHVTERGDVWVAVNAGVMHFDGNIWHHYDEADGLRDNAVTGIASTSDGRAWLAHYSSFANALSVWDGRAWSSAGTAQWLPPSLISRLATGPDGALWAGSFDAGIGRLDGDGWSHVRTEEGPYRLITFDIESHGGTLWFSHFSVSTSGSRYVSRRDASGWRDFSAADGLPAASTLTYAHADAAVDPNGAYWRGVRAPDGAARPLIVVHSDGGASRLFGPADGLPDDHVQDLAAMARGTVTVWAAYDAGLFMWDGVAWSAADLTGLPSTALSAVAERDGSRTGSSGQETNGWIGGTGFVAHGSGRPGGSWTVYLAGPETGLPTGKIVDIDSQQLGGTWIATEGGAVARLDGDHWTSWPAAEVMGGAQVDSLYGIVADRAGRAWISGGTSDGRTVAHFDGTTWAQFGPADGAPETAAFDVAIADDCSVWFAGITSIAEFKPEGGCPGTQPLPSPTAGPTSSPTAVPQPTPTVHPTIAPTPVPSPSPTADQDTRCVCRGLREAVPATTIDAAIASPESVFGWGKPRDPGKPVSPYNPLRECLSMRNPASPYHPLFNGLQWHAGCR